MATILSYKVALNYHLHTELHRMGAVSKDSVLGGSLALSVVSLVLLFGLTCAVDPVQFESTSQGEYDEELVKLQVAG